MGKVDFRKIVKDARESETYLVEKASMSFLADIWRIMKEKKITQKQLAEKAGLKESYISRIFARKGNLTLATMVKLSKHLDTSVKIGVEAEDKSNQQHDIPLKKESHSVDPIITNIHHVNTRWHISEGGSNEGIYLTA
jgi:transcriptional regulator with XRE-family HTH domain